MSDLFLGQSIEYWIELERQTKSLNYTHLIEEIARLRGRVSFYEQRIKEMHDLTNLGKSN